MKKLGELMKDMGFRKDSDQQTQEAFLKYLMKSAEGVAVVTPTEKKLIQKNEDKNIIQLSFDFDDEPKNTQPETRKKTS